MKITKQLSFKVDILMIAQWRFNLWWFTKLKLNICCVHLFMLAKIAKNELDLSLYSLSSKTSRYAHFGHNRLIVYRHPVSRLMLLLQPQFWISEHPVCRLWNPDSRLRSRRLLPSNRITVCQDPISRFPFGYILPNIRPTGFAHPVSRLLQWLLQWNIF